MGRDRVGVCLWIQWAQARRFGRAVPFLADLVDRASHISGGRAFGFAAFPLSSEGGE